MLNNQLIFTMLISYSLNEFDLLHLTICYKQKKLVCREKNVLKQYTARKHIVAFIHL